MSVSIANRGGATIAFGKRERIGRISGCLGRTIQPGKGAFLGKRPELGGRSVYGASPYAAAFLQGLNRPAQTAEIRPIRSRLPKRDVARPRFAMLTLMKRRTFLQSSVVQGLLGSAALSGFSLAAAPDGKAREYYELRTYTLKTAKKSMLDDYLSKAFIPRSGAWASARSGFQGEHGTGHRSRPCPDRFPGRRRMRHAARTPRGRRRIRQAAANTSPPPPPTRFMTASRVRSSAPSQIPKLAKPDPPSRVCSTCASTRAITNAPRRRRSRCSTPRTADLFSAWD